MIKNFHLNAIFYALCTVLIYVQSSSWALNRIMFNKLYNIGGKIKLAFLRI